MSERASDMIWAVAVKVNDEFTAPPGTNLFTMAYYRLVGECLVILGGDAVRGEICRVKVVGKQMTTQDRIQAMDIFPPVPARRGPYVTRKWSIFPPSLETEYKVYDRPCVVAL